MSARQLAIQAKIEERIKTTAEREQYAKVYLDNIRLRLYQIIVFTGLTKGVDSKRSCPEGRSWRYSGT